MRVTVGQLDPGLIGRSGGLRGAGGGRDGFLDPLRGQLVLLVELDHGSGIRIEDIARLVPDDHVQMEEVVPEIDLGRNGLLEVPLLVQREGPREDLAPVPHEVLHEEENGPPLVVVGPVELLPDPAPFPEDGRDFLDDGLLFGRHLLPHGRLLDEGLPDFDVGPRVDPFEGPIPDAVAEEPGLLLAEVVNRVPHFQFEAVGPIVLEVVRHWKKVRRKAGNEELS